MIRTFGLISLMSPYYGEMDAGGSANALEWPIGNK